MTKSWPVQYELASLARNATRRETSSGCPTLGIASRATNPSPRRASSLIMGVSIAPGMIAFTRMP